MCVVLCSLSIFIAVAINFLEPTMLTTHSHWNPNNTKKKVKRNETKRLEAKSFGLHWIASASMDHRRHNYCDMTMEMRLRLICVVTAYDTAVRIIVSGKLLSCRNNSGRSGNNSTTFVSTNIVWCATKYRNFIVWKWPNIRRYFAFDGRVIFAPSWHFGLIRTLFAFSRRFEKNLYIDFTLSTACNFLECAHTVFLHF